MSTSLTRVLAQHYSVQGDLPLSLLLLIVFEDKARHCSQTNSFPFLMLHIGLFYQGILNEDRASKWPKVAIFAAVFGPAQFDKQCFAKVDSHRNILLCVPIWKVYIDNMSCIYLYQRGRLKNVAGESTSLGQLHPFVFISSICHIQLCLIHHLNKRH